MSWLPRLAAVVAAVTLVLSGTAPASADAPRAAIQTPTTGAAVEVGVPVLFSGNAWNGEAGGIISVELSVDGGETWFEVGTKESWHYAYTPTEPGVLTVVARSSTNSVVGPPTVARTLHVGVAGSPPPVDCNDCGFWFSSFTYPHDPDTEPVELGTRVRFDRPGLITAVSVTRGDYQGAITARVWSGEGDLLAEQASTATGFSTKVTLPAPVPVTAGTDYVVSYYTPAGGYAASEDFFTGTVVSAPFIAPHDGVHGAGVYHYGVDGGFPTDSWHDSNYWVTPYFRG